MENVVTGNFIGTGSDGNTGNDQTANKWGLSVKDNSYNNYVTDNVIANSTDDRIWHRHNYTGSNTIVGNRIGVGIDGDPLGNGQYGVYLRGHDDLYQDNIVANNEDGSFFVSDTTGGEGAATNYPSEKTLGNVIRQNTFYNTVAPFVDIEDEGQNDNDDGAHLLLNYPTVTGIGPGQVYGKASDGCTVEVYVSGSVANNGTLDPASASSGEGAAWIGRVETDGAGGFSLAETTIRSGKDLTLLATDPDGNTSEFSPSAIVPESFEGSGSNAGASLGRFERPAVPGRPDPYQARSFVCEVDGSTLSWDDAGVVEYYVFYTVNGTEGYVGPVQATSVTVPKADSYRVEHWDSGFATNATCLGEGVVSLTCSHQASTLSWTDAGADEYYAYATDNGVERYLGAVRGTEVAAAAADSYRVEKWVDGSVTNAVCST